MRGQSEIDLLYDSNSKRIADFIGHVSTAYADVAPKDLSLTIFTGASPEGPAELNRRLGEQRGIALRDLLMARMPGRVAHVTVVNQGSRWGELYPKWIRARNPGVTTCSRILGTDLPMTPGMATSGSSSSAGFKAAVCGVNSQRNTSLTSAVLAPPWWPGYLHRQKGTPSSSTTPSSICLCHTRKSMLTIRNFGL